MVPRSYPLLRQRDRGSHAGLQEIVFSESHYWEEAQAFANAFIEKHRMKLLNRCDGPDAWLWDVKCNEHVFVFGYDDYPCETVLFPTTLEDQEALLDLFEKIKGGI
jgi:hypothetical protein